MVSILHPARLRPGLVAAVLLLGLAPGVRAQDGTPPPRDTVENRIRQVVSGLRPASPGGAGEPAPFRLEDRLAAHRVPAVSVAVIQHGEVEWARAWGWTEAGNGIEADTTTLFQAASISKPVAAIAALRLVEEGTLELDADVNGALSRWRVPENGLMATERVTLRRLLSHSAGTTVHGFPGYADGEPVPTLVQLLDGAGPANTGPVRVDLVPGSEWRYSGGGTSVVQLLMEDATGRPFAELMRELVLDPAEMPRSTYEQPLPGRRAAEAAVAHGGDGSPVPGRFHIYPEQAAAGLWTTPSELARLAIQVQRALEGDTGGVISPEMAERMLTHEAGGFGLGFAVDGEGDDLRFSHGGSNHGFRAHFVAYAHRGQGAVIMTNGAGGGELAAELLRAIASTYDWPGFPLR
jgi:CubicO group peptidase (beta-lactamase class C family)